MQVTWFDFGRERHSSHDGSMWHTLQDRLPKENKQRRFNKCQPNKSQLCKYQTPVQGDRFEYKFKGSKPNRFFSNIIFIIHLLLKRSSLHAQLGLDVPPEMKPLHISLNTAHSAISMQTKHLHIFLHTFIPCLPPSTRTSHSRHHDIGTTGWTNLLDAENATISSSAFLLLISFGVTIG